MFWRNRWLQTVSSVSLHFSSTRWHPNVTTARNLTPRCKHVKTQLLTLSMTLPSNILLSMSEYLSDLGDLHQLPLPPHCSAPALPRPLAGITPALLLPRLAGGRSQDSSASTTEGTNCKSPQLDRQMDNCLPIPLVLFLWWTLIRYYSQLFCLLPTLRK